MGQIHFVTFIKLLQEENHYWLREFAFREYLQNKLDRFNLATETDLDT